MFEALIAVGLVYVTADFILGIALGRCVLPGLACRTCRREKGRS